MKLGAIGRWESWFGASMMTVRVLVEVRSFWSVAT
jgi:hypothetical protein